MIEVPIIVGSILLAFSVDAGWDLRAERVERTEILEGLRGEYLEHHEAYRATVSRAEARMADIQLLMSGVKALDAGTDLVELSLFQLLTVTTTDPGRGVRDALVSSGKLESLHNVELQLRLADWRASSTKSERTKT